MSHAPARTLAATGSLHHPCRRHEGLCCGGGAVVSYPQRGICDNPFLWCGGHMAEVTFDMGEAVWRMLQPIMPAGSVAERCPPNSAVHQRYVGARYDKKGWHTDSKPTRAGKVVEQYENTPVISVSLGATMCFWVRSILSSPPGVKRRGVPTVAAVLRDGGVWVWMPTDDHSHEHGVWYPLPSEGFDAENDIRFVVVYRWVRGARLHDPETRRNLSGDEYVELHL